MNKEDLWVRARHRAIMGRGIRASARGFEHAATVSDLERWNLYIPQWAQIQPVWKPHAQPCLEIRTKNLTTTPRPSAFPPQPKSDGKVPGARPAVATGTALYAKYKASAAACPMGLRLDQHLAWFRS